MNLIGQKLNSLSRLSKTILVLLNDLFLAFTCWIVFGPPMATINPLISSIELITSQIYSFIIPAILFLLYFYFFGYYRSVIRFFDSRDSHKKISVAPQGDTPRCHGKYFLCKEKGDS